MIENSSPYFLCGKIPNYPKRFMTCFLVFCSMRAQLFHYPSLPFFFPHLLLLFTLWFFSYRVVAFNVVSCSARTLFKFTIRTTVARFVMWDEMPVIKRRRPQFRASFYGAVAASCLSISALHFIRKWYNRMTAKVCPSFCRRQKISEVVLQLHRSSCEGTSQMGRSMTLYLFPSLYFCIIPCSFCVISHSETFCSQDAKRVPSHLVSGWTTLSSWLNSF